MVHDVAVDCFGDLGLHRIQCCMVIHHSEVMVSVSNASHIVVYPLVRFECRHIGLHKGILWHCTCLPVCGFACMLESYSKDCSSHTGLKYLLTLHEHIMWVGLICIAWKHCVIVTTTLLKQCYKKCFGGTIHNNVLLLCFKYLWQFVIQILLTDMLQLFFMFIFILCHIT